MAAESYQQSSATVQLEAGKNFIHTDVLPKPEDTILDLGCGTGELSAYLAELVGPRGYIIGVDPNFSRLQLAKETHRHVENLSFIEGNSNQFEGMGSEKFDIIFSNFVLHWIPEKSEAFRNMLNSLKPGGKVAIQYVDALPPLLVSSLEILNPETHEQLKNKLHLVKRDDVDLICTTAGFTVVRSYYARKTVNVYPSVESLLQWLVSTSQGVFDLQLVTQERIKLLLQKFGNPPFDFTANAFDCKLVAVKPKSSQTL
ncbi:uncharacterized protein LOC111343502 [Stylophora pistillata]|uniref:uncharacterized protein LOC111343502 n=1 Tax=Stylophora pistillata TaxID=50429 RepID=UPI000C053391|nr:uncharacterized protein LOC111343502 [Stylophora pistillata]